VDLFAKGPEKQSTLNIETKFLTNQHMETREFAAKVLFSNTLEEKLAPPVDLTDHLPGRSMETPGEPGRPVDLRLRRDGVRAGFPGSTQLINEEHRGILLHFFANHELLATELMALVLLKFPEAPAEFRRDIVHTLQEEQNHTKWYLKRMQECGVNFGDFPLSGFFWDSIAPMETPLDYVTRLSLTFEQANLDYARHYAKVLMEAGDPETARILARIYRDEIGHVGYGLKWFQRWKAAGESDWEAYKKQLPFPLSPARGRGNVPFNAEGRRKAGLAEDFIHEMKVFSQSKGRTPNLLWFTPDAEAAMAYGLEGKGYSPRTEVRELQHDLEILPAFLCHRDDVILVRRSPSREHRHKLLEAGLELPECEVLTGNGDLAADSLQRQRKINDLRPWAWCPQSAALMRPLNPGHVADRWNMATRQLYAKDWQVQNLGIDSMVCRTPEELVAAAGTLAESGHSEAVAKAPFGAAGQKNRKFLPTDVTPLRPWANRIIARQGSVVVEPWLDRVLDFSAHYDVSPCGLRHVGFVQLGNDRRGQFQACIADQKFCRGLPPELTRFLMSGILSVYEKEIPTKLKPLLHAANYAGPVGIDAFVYRTPEGSLALRPVVEVNPRFTMGRLTWELMRRVAAGRSVRFELIRAKSPVQMIAQLESANPPQLNRKGKLLSGCVVINEPQSVLAVLTVGVA
jgi:uncharacterized ferritin-like protein (DUF455 family)